MNTGEQQIMDQFTMMMFEMENECINDKKDTVEVSEEDLCPICFYRASNCQIEPCEHVLCKICIQTHLQNK
jgi:hypothetical protein